MTDCDLHRKCLPCKRFRLHRLTPQRVYSIPGRINTARVDAQSELNIRTLARQLNMNRSTVQYHYNAVQQLHPIDNQRQSEYYVWVINNIKGENSFTGHQL
ncbi:hypothetical protein CEXT_683031 [Caerostris extrusa]|uniref:Uncharacterized protein n=1 Tax=Caerostris extrusa TaxID=172846 RepID=A0AAV4V9H3_CAEEX|nr:hypothetical protein CEXT_683031 [Caerostris extrusa]